jgi:hypothetical protein
MKLKGRIAIGAALAVTGALAALPTGASAATFSNQASISIGPNSVAATYPSNINVAGLTGSITKVRATLFGITGEDTRDMQVLLVGPAGQSTVLMRNACGDNANGYTLGFDDAAAGSLPFGSCSGLSGSFKPTDPDPNDSAFTAPAPPKPYGSTLSVFNTTQPNGTWRLFIEDDVVGVGAHTIGGGWSLDIDTSPDKKADGKKAKKCAKRKGKKGKGGRKKKCRKGKKKKK